MDPHGHLYKATIATYAATLTTCLLAVPPKRVFTMLTIGRLANYRPIDRTISLACLYISEFLYASFLALMVRDWKS